MLQEKYFGITVENSVDIFFHFGFTVLFGRNVIKYGRSPESIKHEFFGK
jgi:hypothetical protein